MLKYRFEGRLGGYSSSRDRSKVLTYPLPFNVNLAAKLPSLKIDKEKFTTEQTELQVISSATRTHRVLSEQDVEYLLRECLNIG